MSTALAATLGCEGAKPTGGAPRVAPSASAEHAAEGDGTSPVLVRPAERLPMVSVFAAAPGYSVEEVAQRVTQPLEEACGRLASARAQSSVSHEGAAVIFVELEPAADPYEAIRALRALVERAATTLPADVEPPVLTPHPSERLVRLRYWMESDHHTLEELRELHDQAIRNKILQVAGVQRLPACGGGRPEVVLEVDRGRLGALGVKLEAIRSAIQQAQLPKPGGMLLRLGGNAVEVDDLLRLPIAPTQGSATLQLADLATIRRQISPDRCRAFSNQGREGVMGEIHVGPHSSAAETRERVRRVLGSIRPQLPPDVKLREIPLPELDRESVRFSLAWVRQRAELPTGLLGLLRSMARGRGGPSDWYLQIGAAESPSVVDEALSGTVREATLTVVTPAADDSPVAVPSWVPELEAKLAALADVRLRATQATAGSSRAKQRIELRVFYGADRQLARPIASQAAKLATAIPGVLSAWLPDDSPKPTVSYRLDDELARRLGIRPHDVARAVRAASGQLELGRVRISPDRTIPLRLMVKPGLGKGPSALGDVPIPTATGKEVRLAEIARVELLQGQAALRRQDRRSFLAVEIALASGQAEETIEQLRQGFAKDLAVPAGVELEMVVLPPVRPKADG